MANDTIDGMKVIKLTDELKERLIKLCRECAEFGMRQVGIEGVWTDHVHIWFDETEQIRVMGKSEFGNIAAKIFTESLQEMFDEYSDGKVTTKITHTRMPVV